MIRIRYLTLAMWLCSCISIFGQVGSGFNPNSPSEPNEPNLPHRLTVVAEPAGAGNPSPSGKYIKGTTVNLNAYPATGFKLVRWTNANGDELSTNTTFSIIKSASDEVITAHYTYAPAGPGEPQDPWLTLTLPLTLLAAEGGSIGGAGRYVPGTTVTIDAYPSSGYTFKHWVNQHGVVVSTVKRFGYTVSNVRDTLTAYFDYTPNSPGEPPSPDATPKHHIFTSATEGGTVSGNQYIKEGENTTVAAYSNSGYEFVGWFKDGQLYNTNSSFTYTMLTEDVSFEARFKFNPGAPAEPNISGSAKKQLFYIENANGFQGEMMNLTVFLSSLTDLSDMTFQMSFPERLVPSETTGIIYSDNLNSYTTKSCVKVNETTLKFTLNGGTLKAGNGPLVTFKIAVPQDYSTGTVNPVRMAQISFKEADATTSTTANARNAHIGIYKPGDVNGDNVIDVVDIHSVMLYIKGLVEPSDGFIREAADLNGDNHIDEQDMTLLVNIVKQDMLLVEPSEVPSANLLSIPTFTTAPAVTHRYDEGFSVHLTNDVDVWGVQFDVLLPEGITLDTQLPTPLRPNADRMGSLGTEFNLIAAPLTDGWTRVLVYPTSEEHFIVGFEGEIFKIHYCTSGTLPLEETQISMRRVILALQRMDYDRPQYSPSVVNVVDFIPRPYDAHMVINETHVGSFVAPFDVTLPPHVGAYKVYDVVDDVVQAERIDGVIPANTPVILYSYNPIDTTYSGRIESLESVSVGMLTGVFVETTVNVGTYVLSFEGDGVWKLGRVNSAGTTVPESRVYLTAPATIQSPVLDIFWDEDPDAMSAITQKKASAPIYDLQGRRSNTLRSGINIVGGKKVRIK